MNRSVIRIAVIASVLILAGSAWAHAQSPVVKVGFPFVAGGKTLSAGNYAVDLTDAGNVVLTPEQGGTPVELTPTKQLSRRKTQRAQLVFDVVGSARFLSEVWLPGKGGCQVGKQPDAQEQETVNGPKAQQ